MSVRTPPPSAALTASAEAWERMVGRYQAWCARHLSLVRRVRFVVLVAWIAAVPLLVLAVLFLPRFGRALCVRLR